MYYINFEVYTLHEIKPFFKNIYPILYVDSRVFPQDFVILYNTETQSPVLI